MLCLQLLPLTASATAEVKDRLFPYSIFSNDRKIEEYGTVDSAYLNNFWHVSGGGDVNGDGYDDIIASHKFESDGDQMRLYFGNANGVIDQSADFHSAALFPNSDVSSAEIIGDLNNDGFDDIAIGSVSYPSDQMGSIFIYLGSATGVDATNPMILQSGLRLANLGAILSGTGDINGDGYDDFIAGAPKYNLQGSIDPLLDVGAAYIYLGSSTGVDTSPHKILTIALGDSRFSANFGSLVSRAGDVNGDGFADVMASAPNYLDNNSYSGLNGLVNVYLGSAQGLDETPQISLVRGPDDAAHLGRVLTGPGDLNNDGYDDIITGTLQSANSYLDTRIHYGSPQGITLTNQNKGLPVIHGGSTSNVGHLTRYLGDVNQDGYDDFMLFDDANESSIDLYVGSPHGLEPRVIHSFNVPSATYGVRASRSSDFNGDGLPDLIFSNVKANNPNDSSDHLQTGGFYVFLSKVIGFRSIELDQTSFDPGFDNITGFEVIGDANGDGFDDAAVADSNYYYAYLENTTTFVDGKVSIFLGSASGFETTPHRELVDNGFTNSSTTIEKRYLGEGVFGEPQVCEQ